MFSSILRSERNGALPPRSLGACAWSCAALIVMLLTLAALLPLSYGSSESNNWPLTTRRISSAELELMWNVTDPKIQGASDAILVIQDGPRQQSAHLDADRIRKGAFRYTPTSWDVTFRVRVFRPGFKSAVEEIRTLWSDIEPPVLPPTDRSLASGRGRPGSCGRLASSDVDALVEVIAARERIDPRLLRVVMQIESAFRPCAVSLKGAQGLMQLMPATAREYGVVDPFNTHQNVAAGARYLKELLNRYHGNVTLALSAYNAGPSAVDRANGTPEIAETVQYVNRIVATVR